MGKEKKNKDLGKVVVVEFQVSMHCNACERTVSKAISKFKGVEKFMTDMTRHRVVVTGRINPEKVMKKLKKKTGKRVLILSNKDDAKDETNEGDSALGGNWKPAADSMMLDDWRESVIFTMFSDENPNACLIM